MPGITGPSEKETRHAEVHLPQFPFTKQQCDQMIERWTTPYCLNGGETLLLIMLCALGVPGAFDAQKSAGQLQPPPPKALPEHCGG